MVRLNHLSPLEFAGVDAVRFLQSQLSADLLSIPDGAAGFACLCNPSGRALGLLLVRPGSDSCLALCAASLVSTLAEMLPRFVLRLDVRISPRPDLAVVGIRDRAAQPDPFRNPSGLTYAVRPAAEFDGPPGENEALAWQAAELEAGIAWLDPGTSGRYLPQMLGYESLGALSFRKGCFPGQEIIARTRYLGKLTRRPVRCRVPAPLEAAGRDEVALRGPVGEAQAEVVDSARCADGATWLFLVARMDEEFTPQALLWKGREVAVEFLPPAREGDQGWATT